MSSIAAILAEIERLYYGSTAESIEADFARAIELLKQLPDEDTRAKAHVYMEGLAEMQSEWSGRRPAKGTRPARDQRKKPG